MGQYKVPQDVEAEDKIIGALTMKQFLYAVIGVVYGLITFQIFKGAPVLFVIIGVPPTILFLMLGLYKRQDQPFEALFLALMAFLVRPRKLVWAKDPIEQVFQLKEPPPKAQPVQRDPSQVRGQLERLAQIVDTRGWAAKQPELQEPSESAAALDPSDRLATFEIAPAPTPMDAAGLNNNITLSDDILDFSNNPSARNLDVLIADSVKHIREEALEKMREQASQPPTPAPKPVAAPAPTTQAAPKAPAAPVAASTSEMTTNPIAAILKTAMENSELTVSTIAAQAHKQAALVEGQPVDLRASTPQPNQEPTKPEHKATHHSQKQSNSRHHKHASRPSKHQS